MIPLPNYFFVSSLIDLAWFHRRFGNEHLEFACFWVVFSGFSGGVPGMFQRCSGDVLGMFRGCSGDVLGVPGDVLVVFWGCSGDVLGVFWGCSRDVLGSGKCLGCSV